MTKQARVAVIGAGWWSTYTHIPALRAHPSAALVAVCDTDPAKLEAATRTYDIAHAYADYHEMIAREPLDGVIVATSHATHFAIVKDCLEHDLHVLVEKPMTLGAADARDLVELARRCKRELIVGYPWHYNPHVLRAREVLASGALGAVQYVSCIFSSGILGLLQGRDGSETGSAAYPIHGPGNVYSRPDLSGGGMGHLQLTHSAGVMFFVSGLRARRACAWMNNHGLALDLVDAITVEFEGGALSTVGGTGNGVHRKLDVQIHCERGAIDLDLVAATTLIRGPDGVSERFELADEAAAYPRFAPATNLVDVILDKAANGSPADVGWRTVELLDAAYRSAKADGQPITIQSLY